MNKKCTQLFHKLSHRYMFRHYRVILRELVINTLPSYTSISNAAVGRGQLKCDGTRVEIKFRLSAKRTSPFKSAGTSVQSTTGSRAVRISGSNAGYTMFRGSVKSTGYPLHSPVSPSLPLPCVTVCHHISTGVYVLCFSVDCLLANPANRQHVPVAVYIQYTS